MAEGYPFLNIKAKIDEAFLERVVSPLGGQRFDGSREFPEGVRAVDFLVRDYALELKTLERDPIITQPERVGRIAEFISELRAKGELKEENGEIHLTGAASQTVWRKFVGVQVGRVMADAAEQVRSTRVFLKRPDLSGAVFIVNEGAPFIDLESLDQLVSAQRQRFNNELTVAFYFSCIPAQVAGESRPVVMAGYHAEQPAHAPFCDELLAVFRQELSKTLGKEKLDPVPAQTLTAPVRAAFTAAVGKTGSLTFR